MNLRNEYNETTEFNSRPFRKLELFCGIVDDLGIDIIQKHDSANIGYLKLRARMNNHRNTRIFVCAIKKQFVPNINKELEDAITFYNKLKKISVTFVEDISY